ncbi:MAG: helix-turn-helix domain-containing protein [Pseudomonadota bacterium]|nr:helix-turn-helix domain-containing protein [Pseudomonadota bacterium]
MHTAAATPFTKNPVLPFGMEGGAHAEGLLSPGFLLRLLDEIDYGLIVAGVDGRIHHANHLARHELGSARLLWADGDGRLSGAHNALTRQLHAALGDGAQGKRRLLTFSHDSHSLPVAVVPLSHALEGSDDGLVLLVMARQHASGNLTLDMFAREHSLTPTEQAVLRALCEGCAVQDIATRHGVAESTVRTQVRSLRDKTGAGGIRQLVQRVLSLPPMVPALRADGRMPRAPARGRAHPGHWPFALASA